jgi:hypothetical protein
MPLLSLLTWTVRDARIRSAVAQRRYCGLAFVMGFIS